MKIEPINYLTCCSITENVHKITFVGINKFVRRFVCAGLARFLCRSNNNIYNGSPFICVDWFYIGYS
jgi:hypothetical protein